MSKNKQRIWQLRLNLDAFNALAASFYSDEHRALAFQGLGLGMNNGQCPTTTPEAFRIAFDLGLSMRNEAETLILTQSESGQKSAKVRKDRYGSAQPKAQNIEASSEGASEGASKVVRGNIEPNHKPITNNHKPINQEPKTIPQPPKGHDLAKAEELYQAYPKRISKAAALKAIVSAMKSTPFETLMDAVKEYAKAINATTKPEDMQFVPAAGPWFNAGRWEDDRSAWWNGKRPEQKLEQKFVPFEAKPKLTRAMMSPDLWHLYPEIEE